MEYKEQDFFLNQVIQIDSNIDALSLLELFKKIEIQSRQDGAPIVHLPKPYHSKYHCECSISHDGDSAISFALMQKK